MTDNAHPELAHLLARCALRDQAALKQLHDRLAPYFNGVAYRILGNDSLCREVLQDAFVQIWQNADRYRPDIANPLTWMTSIVRYRALDARAREQRHYTEERDDTALADTSHPGDNVEQWHLHSRLEECLGQLNPRVSDSLKLAYQQGYTRDEIADRLGSNSNTVKSWLRRGAESLKKCLEAEHE